MKLNAIAPLLLSTYIRAAFGVKVVLTNDDGWAVAQIRAQYDALTAAGHDVVLSCPAENKSGSGSLTLPPSPALFGCQFDSCPHRSPAIGSDPKNSRLNYVNSFPVDAAREGITGAGPVIWGTGPDLVISGPNVGTNMGLTTPLSGTIGAASYAALHGIPSIAFSGESGSRVSYTTLASDPDSPATQAAHIYSELVIKLTNTLISNGAPYLPARIALNVNFASTDLCPDASSYRFVLTRVLATAIGNDATTCGHNRLPAETMAIKQGCIATVSVMNPITKWDASPQAQAAVLSRLEPILSCL
ncbi:sure-like protein [Coprinopsis sp. MPI-PUGE-AT-0042]|nr:sure-like protein [Coprinopsis sp. MPI-PUGE-AT-0042]